jgi:hypothetical protein
LALRWVHYFTARLQDVEGILMTRDRVHRLNPLVVVLRRDIVIIEG